MLQKDSNNQTVDVQLTMEDRIKRVYSINVYILLIFTSFHK